MTIAVHTWLRVHAGLMLSLRGSALSSRRRPSRVEGVAVMRACLLGVGGTACVDRVLFCWAEAMDLCAGALAGMALRLPSLFSSLSPSLPLLQILGWEGHIFTSEGLAEREKRANSFYKVKNLCFLDKGG